MSGPRDPDTRLQEEILEHRRRFPTQAAEDAAIERGWAEMDRLRTESAFDDDGFDDDDFHPRR